jgi:hypothetical protein
MFFSDDEIIGIAREFRRGVLGDDPPDGRCAMVAWPLAGYLSFLGLDGVETDGCDYPDDHPASTEWVNHVWIVLKDGRILDPTADQFDIGLPPIYLGPPDPRIHLNKD